MKNILRLSRRLRGSPKPGYTDLPVQEQPAPAPLTPLESSSGSRPAENAPELPVLKRSLGEKGWAALKVVLSTICESSDAFPPLKAALTGILKLIDVVDVANDLQENFLNVAQRINGFERVIARYTADNELPAVIRKRLEGITSAFTLVKNTIDVKTGRGLIARTLSSLDDAHAIEKVLQFVAALIDEFNIDTLINLEVNAEHIRSGVDNLLRNNGLETLRHVPTAEYDSQTRKGCMEGTRVGILGDLVSWSMDSDSPRIFWLSGMAGTGKSAISWSFCDMLKTTGHLGGSFFCLRGSSDRSDVSRILPSFARLLAQQDAVYETALIRALNDDPSAAHKSVDQQLKSLLEVPLRNAFAQSHTFVLVLDALDECADETEVGLLLDELLSIAPHLPIKFFITSRPERHVRLHLESHLSDAGCILRLHEIEADTVYADLNCYISNRLQETRDRFTRNLHYSFPDEWPSPSDVAVLARFSGKLFIYAFTVIEYMRQSDPAERLQEIISMSYSKEQPLVTNVDMMYRYILERALDPTIQPQGDIRDKKRMLAILVAIRVTFSVESLSRLIGVPIQRIRVLLDQFHAVVNVPQDNRENSLSLFHTSFVDYITTTAPDHLRVDPSNGHDEIAHSCVKILHSDALHFNVSQCSTSHKDNSQRKIGSIWTPLLYCCLHWVHHVASSSDTAALVFSMEEIFTRKFLFWVEVLGATGYANVVSPLIVRAISASQIREYASSRFKAFLRDANEFAINCCTAYELSVPHIYLSAVPSLHPSSEIYKMFSPALKNTPKFIVNGIARKFTPLLHLNIVERVYAVCTSSNGLFAAASQEGLVRIYNVLNGEMIMQPLRGHKGPVSSIIFSSDGSRLVSCGVDATVRIWDLQRGGCMMKKIVSANDEIPKSSVSLSSDLNRIACGRGDNAISIWDSTSGIEILKLVGHSGRVNQVLFSNDGRRIYSCSNDSTVRVWDSEDGTLVFAALVGHRRTINSIALSPDGSRLCSGSNDCTVCFWDTDTGQLVAEPVTHFATAIWSVAYSPDGTRVAISVKGLIYILNAVDPEQALQTFVAHSAGIYSLCFSHDGCQIVSGCADGSVRIWDATLAVLPTDTFESLSNAICHIAYSPDGSFIAASVSDKTIRIWDAHYDNSLLMTLVGHTEAVISAVFSSDSKRIVSASYDNSVRIWSVETGDLILNPLLGHTSTVAAAVFSPDDTKIASCSPDSSVRLWDAVTGEEVHCLRNKSNKGLTSILFSPDGKWLAACSISGSVLIWDAQTLDPLDLSDAKLDTITHTHCISFSPDGRYIASAGESEIVCIWKVGSTEPAKRLATGPLIRTVFVITYSPDGKCLALAAHKTIWILNVDNGNPFMGPLKGHTGRIRSLAFSPDQMRLVSSSDDMTIKLWDTSPASVDLFNKHGGYATSEIHQWDVPEKSGWVKDSSGNLILWVPPDYHSFLHRPPNIANVPNQRVEIDIDEFVHGDEWTECFVEDKVCHKSSD